MKEKIQPIKVDTESMGNGADILERSRPAITAIKAASVLIGLVGVGELVEITSIYGLGPELSSAEGELTGYDMFMFLIVIAFFVSLIFGAVFFIRWFHKSHRNVAKIPWVKPKYASKWAGLGFFVPFINFVRPKQIMEEVWRGSMYMSGDSETELWETIDTPKAIQLWWTFFLLSGMVDRVSMRIYTSADSPEKFALSAVAGVASAVLMILAGKKAMELIGDVTSLQFKGLTGRNPGPTERGSTSTREVISP